MYDVTALGELLIDFTHYGASNQGNPIFEANPGGAPCNVLSMLVKLGKRVSFLGKVGDDMFGRMLRDTLLDVGIGERGLVTDPKVNTTLAFVKTAPDGDRDFSFFRNPGADTQLRPEELDREALAKTRIFHFGSLSLTNEPARGATQAAVTLARESGALISFDPNLREPLWDSMDSAKEQMLWGISQCGILKVAEEELEFLTGCAGLAEGSAALLGQYPNIRILFVTMGKKGASVYYGGESVSLETYTGVKTIDTTGAGDTFCGCCLAYILDHGLDNLSKGDLTDMLRFANAAASLVTTRPGAIRSMPTREEVEELMAQA